MCEYLLPYFLGIHKVAFEGSKLGIPKDTLANKVVPFLIPIAMDNNLNLSQVTVCNVWKREWGHLAKPMAMV